MRFLFFLMLGMYVAGAAAQAPAERVEAPQFSKTTLPFYPNFSFPLWVEINKETFRRSLRSKHFLPAVTAISSLQRCRCLRKHSADSDDRVRSGAAAHIHRFGSSPNEHVHFHCYVNDGVFDLAEVGDTDTVPGVVFHAAAGAACDAGCQAMGRAGA